ncbi:hypothetical protein ACHAW6_008700 [Cyclotella cf. meneghiniana]
MKLDPIVTASSFDDVLTKLELTIKRVHQEDDRKDEHDVQRGAALQRLHGATLSSVLAQKSRNQQHYKSSHHLDEERRDDEEDGAREPESIVVRRQTMTKQARSSSINENKFKQHCNIFLIHEERRDKEEHRESDQTQVHVQRAPPTVPTGICEEIQNEKHDVKLPIDSAQPSRPHRPSNPNDIIWRAYAKTKSLGKVVSGIVVAQAATRRWIAVRHYNRLRIEKSVREHGAIKIAAAWRKSHCQFKYTCTLKDVTICQSITRRFLAARAAAKMRRQRRIAAAMLIDSKLRSFVVRMRYVRMKAQATRIQSLVRAWKTARCYANMKNAVINIAATWKRYFQRIKFKKTLKEITFCQSCTRRYLATRRVKILLHTRKMSAATLIQSSWRAVYGNKWFVNTRSSVIRIQSHIRKFIAMERFYQSKRAASKIVTCWKRHHCQRVYTRIVRDVIVCQSAVRRSAATRRFKLRLHQHRVASVTLIQARWRVFVSTRNSAASKIATQWRKFNCVMIYKRTMKVAIVCQSMTRRYLAGRQVQLLRHEREISSAVAVQAKWRAFVASELLSQIRLKVVLLQSIVRGWRAKKYFSQCKKASISIASSWRRHHYQMLYRKIIRGVIECQSIFRGHSATVKVELLRHNCRIASAVLIQGRWRAFFETKRYNQIICDVILIQSNVRKMIGKRYREHFLKDAIMNQSVSKQFSYKTAAAMISSQWRVFHFMREYKKLRKATIVCQSIARRNSVAKKAKTLRHERSMAAATLIQSMWRTFVAKTWFNTTKVRVTLFQSLVRRLIARRDAKTLITDKISGRSLIRSIRNKQAATKISSIWRGYNQRLVYKHLIRRIVACQSVLRRYSAKKKVILLRHECHMVSATSIEARWRAFTLSKRFKLMKTHATRLQSVFRRSWSQKYLSQCKLAATKISSQFRKFHCHMTYEQIRREIILCQSVVRRRASTRKVNIKRYERRVSSALVIETRWRSFVTRKRFSESKLKLHLVQSVVRRWIAELYLDRIKKAVTKISCQWRGIQCRVAYKQVVKDVVICQSLARRCAATKEAKLIRQKLRVLCVILIQTSWRSHIFNRQYIKNKLGVLLLQATVRRWRTGRHSAAITIASRWRKFRCFMTYKQTMRGRCMRAATVIQARWRTYDATENFTRVQMKVAFLQSLFRRWKARRYLQGCKSAATKITSTWKMINCRMAYNQIVNDIIICQTIVRRNIASRKIEQIRHERRMVSATLIQARWRAYKASKGFLQIKLQVTLLQSVTHRWRAEKYLAQNKNAATKIAACWRRFYCLMSTMKVRRDVIICQSIARRKIATNDVKHLAVTKFIETQWVSFLAEKDLIHIRSHVSFIKSIPGAWMTLRVKAATKISSLWRRHFSLVSYRRTLQGMFNELKRFIKIIDVGPVTHF